MRVIGISRCIIITNGRPIAKALIRLARCQEKQTAAELLIKLGNRMRTDMVAGRFDWNMYICHSCDSSHLRHCLLRLATVGRNIFICWWLILTKVDNLEFSSILFLLVSLFMSYIFAVFRPIRTKLWHVLEIGPGTCLKICRWSEWWQVMVDMASERFRPIRTKPRNIVQGRRSQRKTAFLVPMSSSKGEHDGMKVKLKKWFRPIRIKLWNTVQGRKPQGKTAFLVPMTSSKSYNYVVITHSVKSV